MDDTPKGVKGKQQKMLHCWLMRGGEEGGAIGGPEKRGCAANRAPCCMREVPKTKKKQTTPVRGKNWKVGKSTHPAVLRNDTAGSGREENLLKGGGVSQTERVRRPKVEGEDRTEMLCRSYHFPAEKGDPNPGGKKEVSLLKTPIMVPREWMDRREKRGRKSAPREQIPST